MIDKTLPKNKCVGCGACACACPKSCIKMIEDSEGFYRPTINIEDCIDCGICDKACPELATFKKSFFQRRAFAVINKDEEVRRKSSSGGVFSVIAKKIIDDGGVVFGAAFGDNCLVEHVMVDRVDGLERLRGSKYLQSRLGDCYLQVKKLLTVGKTVLFSGTPCQVSGLISYLGKSYDNLYTQDLICHGAPSPKVWEKYLLELEKEYKSKIINVQFRNKDSGWKNYSVCFEFESGEKLIEPFNKNSYMRAFLKNLDLRPSCYDCSNKTVERKSDMTLADFWGIERVLPNLDDDKGTSLVIVHSKKGEELIDVIRDVARFEEVDVNVALIENPSAIKSSILPKKRGKFFKNLDKKTLSKNVSVCTKPNLLVKIKGKIKKLAKRVLRTKR